MEPDDLVTKIYRLREKSQCGSIPLAPAPAQLPPGNTIRGAKETILNLNGDGDFAHRHAGGYHFATGEKRERNSRHLSHHPYYILHSDLNRSGMDRWQTNEAPKKTEDKARILDMTAHNSPSEKKAFRHPGKNGFVSKRIGPD